MVFSALCFGCRISNRPPREMFEPELQYLSSSFGPPHERGERNEGYYSFPFAAWFFGPCGSATLCRSVSSSLTPRCSIEVTRFRLPGWRHNHAMLWTGPRRVVRLSPNFNVPWRVA